MRRQSQIRISYLTGNINLKTAFYLHPPPREASLNNATILFISIDTEENTPKPYCPTLLKYLNYKNAHTGRPAYRTTLVKPSARKAVARELIDTHRLSKRSACLVVGVSRSGFRYQAIGETDNVLRFRLKELAAQFPRYDYLCCTAC